MGKDILLYFIHGLGGDPNKTWGHFKKLIEADPELHSACEIVFHKYPTSIFPLFGLPNINAVASELREQIRLKRQNFAHVILISHSLGGLAVQRYLVNDLREAGNPGISNVFFFAVPFRGARLAAFLLNRQIKFLRASSMELQLLQDDWVRSDIEEYMRKVVLYGSKDLVVSADSATALDVKKAKAIHHGHRRIVKPHSAEDLSFALVKEGILATLKKPTLYIQGSTLGPVEHSEFLHSLGRRSHQQDSVIVLDGYRKLSDKKVPHFREAVLKFIETDHPLRLASMRGEKEDVFVFYSNMHFPLAAIAGHLITDRHDVSLYEHHGPGNWAWPMPSGSYEPLVATEIQEISDSQGHAVVRISINRKIKPAESRVVVPSPILEVDIHPQGECKSGLISSEAQLYDYGRFIRKVLDSIRNKLKNTSVIHVFFSGPPSLAFLLGQKIEEEDPNIVMWNRFLDWGIHFQRLTARREDCFCMPHEIDGLFLS